MLPQALLWHMVFEEEIGSVKGHIGPLPLGGRGHRLQVGFRFESAFSYTALLLGGPWVVVSSSHTSTSKSC